MAIVDTVGVSYLQPPTKVPTGMTAGPPKKLYNVTFRDALDNGYDRDTSNRVSLQSDEFTLTVLKGTTSKKIYPFLATDPVHPRYAPSFVNPLESSIQLEEIDPPPAGGPENLLPADGASVVLGGVPPTNTDS